MAAELGLMSLTLLKKLAHHQQQQPPQSQPPNSSAISSWMWNPNKFSQDEDDSWEVRAFEQDTGDINGTTWPPRSYTCTFCRREFRSAQALGGHMNVHRRERARLHQGPPPHPGMTNTTSSSTLLIPTQEFVTNGGGVCLVYSLANPNGSILSSTPTTLNSCMDSPSTLLSVSTFPTNNLISPNCIPTYNTYPTTPHSINSSVCHSSNTEPSASNNSNENINLDNLENKKAAHSADEELDLELRLGR
ncbi:hypothetical protein ACH5RR_040506 [Cinchona calisaya]|uniref:C2H2-type domain-containing protein n=1 Tax=Cinchona calisaya TaxID=153742 RepID=A0ABD2XRZ4_9GENT